MVSTKNLWIAAEERFATQRDRAEKAEAELAAERERAERLEKAGRLLLDAYGEAHALHDLGECEGSLLMREALRSRGEGPVQIQEIVEGIIKAGDLKPEKP